MWGLKFRLIGSFVMQIIGTGVFIKDWVNQSAYSVWLWPRTELDWLAVSSGGRAEVGAHTHVNARVCMDVCEVGG